jgi:hypothetical protein
MARLVVPGLQPHVTQRGNRRQQTFFNRHLHSLVFAATGPAEAGEVLWGVTNGINDSGFWTGGEIFTVDTGTGAVNVKHAYAYNNNSTDVRGFGDIAISPSGGVYVTYYSNDTGDFKTLAKVNTSTWAFEWTQTMPVQINSLEFVGSTLYLHAGGGAVDGLYKLPSPDGTTDPTFIGNSGYLGSDGDLAYNKLTGKMYNVYCPASTGYLTELNLVTGAGTQIGAFGNTQGSMTYGWAGLAFDGNGKLWAGTYWDQKLYSRSDVSATGTISMEYDLSASLGGNITGLSTIPEPGTLSLLAAAGLGMFCYALRRRKAAK